MCLPGICFESSASHLTMQSTLTARKDRVSLTDPDMNNQPSKSIQLHDRKCRGMHWSLCGKESDLPHAEHKVGQAGEQPISAALSPSRSQNQQSVTAFDSESCGFAL